MTSKIVVNNIEADAGVSTVTFGSNISGNFVGSISVSGVTTVAAGSASAPSISPTGDSNTGIFFPSADTIAFAEGGSEVVRVSSAGSFGIGTNNPSELLHVSQGRVLVESSSFPQVTLKRSSSGAQSDIKWITGSTNKWSIGQALGAVGENLEFYDYGAAATRMKIDTSGNVTVNNGNIVIGTSGKGIDFSAASGSAAGSTSALLDDYEEGTWTPSVEGSTTAGTVSYTLRNGKYTKIGNLVYVEIYVGYTSGTGSGSLRITGLPFTVEAASATYPALSIAYLDSITLSANHTPIFLVSSGNTYIYNYQIPSGGGTNINIPYDGSGTIIISGSYRT